MAGILGITETVASERKQVERSGMRSTKLVSIMPSAGAIVRGEVLGQQKCGAVTVAAKTGGNIGGGTCTPDATEPRLANCMPGVYKAICVTAASGAGTFEIFDPLGRSLGLHGVGATAFNRQIKIVIADGTPDFSVGDAFDITVAELFTYGKYDPDAVDGRQVAAAIAFDDVANLTSAQKARVYMAGEYRLADLTWDADASATEKAKQIDVLAARGIIIE